MPPQDKGKRVAESTDEAIVQKKKAPKVGDGLLKDVCKTRQTEEGHQTSPNPTEKAVTSLGGRGKEGFYATCAIGISIQLKYFIKGEAKKHCSNDQVYLRERPSYAPNMMDALDAMEENIAKLYGWDAFTNYARLSDRDAFTNYARLSDQDAFAYDARLSDLDAFVCDVQLSDRDAFANIFVHDVG
ncbi:hypothetical protein Fot_15033 [Forsythia ovata]|uniref:Uncharacterized protein n=1 Tax=Forsythia ovata TaxID=205694 RepID=A0ABD1W8I2_9LAMI